MGSYYEDCEVGDSISGLTAIWQRGKVKVIVSKPDGREFETQMSNQAFQLLPHERRIADDPDQPFENRVIQKCIEMTSERAGELTDVISAEGVTREQISAE